MKKGPRLGRTGRCKGDCKQIRFLVASLFLPDCQPRLPSSRRGEEIGSRTACVRSLAVSAARTDSLVRRDASSALLDAWFPGTNRAGEFLPFDLSTRHVSVLLFCLQCPSSTSKPTAAR